MKPGIYQGMSYPDYAAIDAVRSSTLKLFKRSAMHARHAMLHPKESPALDRGHAVHACVLEPDKFANWVVAPRKDGRIKESKTLADGTVILGKHDWAEWQAKHVGREIVSASDFDVCEGIVSAVYDHEAAVRLLSGHGSNEVVVVWNDTETGILCKARLDRISTVGGWTFVTDLKTTRNATQWAFSKAAYDYGYHTSAAFYLDGLATLHPAERRFAFIAVESDAPHGVSVFYPDEEFIGQGRRDYRRYLAEFHEAEQTGVWPGYPQVPRPLYLPKYAVDYDPED